MRTLVLVLSLALPMACCALALAEPAPPSPPQTQAQTQAHQRVTFDYHSAFLMNLHHALYDLALHPKHAEPVLARATPAEAADLRAVLAFYRSRYADSDLLFGADMVAIKRALSAADDARRDPHGLALDAREVDALAQAAPVYARLEWSRDDAANRAWIAHACELDARYGAAVQAAIERGLASDFPAAPVRVDVVFDTGTRQGGYTDTQVVLPSGRLDYQGHAALEMLYHEAAHVQTSGRLEQAIAARARARGRDADSELWHVLHFYTVGAAVTEALAHDGIAYVQYAQQKGLYAGPWAGYMAAVESDWKPYLAGRESWQDAIGRMVEQLPAAK